MTYHFASPRLCPDVAPGDLLDRFCDALTRKDREATFAVSVHDDVVAVVTSGETVVHGRDELVPAVHI